MQCDSIYWEVENDYAMSVHMQYFCQGVGNTSSSSDQDRMQVMNTAAPVPSEAKGDVLSDSKISNRKSGHSEKEPENQSFFKVKKW